MKTKKPWYRQWYWLVFGLAVYFVLINIVFFMNLHGPVIQVLSLVAIISGIIFYLFKERVPLYILFVIQIILFFIPAPFYKFYTGDVYQFLPGYLPVFGITYGIFLIIKIIIYKTKSKPRQYFQTIPFLVLSFILALMLSAFLWGLASFELGKITKNCNLQIDIQNQYKCYTYVADFPSTDNCALISINADKPLYTCYTKLAEMTENPDYCGKLPHNDWLDPINLKCRKSVAIALEDPKICSTDVGLEYTEWMLEGSEQEKEYQKNYQEKDKCYLNYAQYYNTPETCNYITDKDAKQNCLNSTN